MELSKVKTLIPAPEDGTSFEIILSASAVRKNSSGVITTGPISVSAYKHSGMTRSSCGLGTIPMQDVQFYRAQYRVDGGSWTNCSMVSIVTGLMQSMEYGIPGSAVQTATSGIAVRLLYGTGLASDTVCYQTAPIPVISDGAVGAQGKRGRFYYFAGYYVQGTEYTGDDNQAPYVTYEWTDSDGTPRTTNYMLVADTNLKDGVYVAPKAANNAAQGIWELMTSDFKFLIAEAIFTSFAKFGSAVFSGDYMISQYGDIEDYDGASEASDNYVLFDPTDLNEGSQADEVSPAEQTVSGEMTLRSRFELTKGKLYTLSAKWIDSYDFTEVEIFLTDAADSSDPVYAKETPASSTTRAVSISVSQNDPSGKISFVAPETGGYYLRAQFVDANAEDDVRISCRLDRRRFIPRYFVDLLNGFAGLTRLSPRSKVPGRAVRYNAAMTNASGFTSQGADVIVIPNRTGGTEIDVYLQDPTENAGRMVTVVNRGTGRVTIRSVMPFGRSRAFMLDTASGWGAAEYTRRTDPLTSGTGAALAVARYWSDGEYWYELEWRTKDGKSRGLDY